MPNRIIKESICTSDTVDKLSWFEAVLFYRLIVNCDDYGGFDGRPVVIKNRLFPLKEGLTVKAVTAAINTLVTNGMVALYMFEGKPFLYLPTWENHQQIRAKKSKYPSPEEGIETNDINGYHVISNVPVIQSNPIQSESNTNTPVAPEAVTPKGKIDSFAREVIDYLNEKNGSKYRYSESSLKHIRARLNENFTVEDCKAVIDKKCQEWKGDPKMEQYLRPETLFGSKFENYLNAPVSSRSFGKRKDVLPDWYNPDPNRDNGKKEEAPELTDKEKREFEELLKLGMERRTQV